MKTHSPITQDLARSKEIVPLGDKAKHLKTLILEPLYPAEAVWGSVKNEQGFIPPMGSLSVYSWLRHRGFAVDFIDPLIEGISPDRLRERLAAARYDVVGLPVFTPTADHVFATAKLIKQALPDCKVILGGVHVTTLPQLTMEQCPECDFVIRHEGELTFDEFLRFLAEANHDWAMIDGLVWRDPATGATVVNKARAFIDNLDDLPVGLYSDLDLKRYVPHPTQYLKLPSYPLMTQRGCPFNCSYCGASTILGRKSRHFSPERVIEEIRVLVRDKGARGLYFQDSTFTIDKAWTMRLMELMIKERFELPWSCNTRADRIDRELLDAMYQAGGRQIFFGIESGNQASLDEVRKGSTVEKFTEGVMLAKAAGFRYVNSFIICLPGETPEMVENTISHAKKLGAYISMFFLPVPYPGTALHDSCAKSGGLRRTSTWSDYIAIDFNNPVYINPNFGIEGMRYWYKKAYIDYYSSPSVWLANLKIIRTREDFARLMRGGRALGSMIAHGLKGFLKYQYRGYHGQGSGE